MECHDLIWTWILEIREKNKMKGSCYCSETTPFLRGDIWEKTIARNINAQPVASCALRDCPNISHPPNAEKTLSKHMTKEETVGFKPF